MKPKPLWRIDVETSSEAEEAVTQLLERASGVPATSCTDLETGAVTVTIFIEKRRGQSRPSRSQIMAGLELIRACGLDPAPQRVLIRTLRPEDWAESWKRHFKPIEIGSSLVVRPSWSRYQPRPGQAVVVLDPGLSFGTGNHPTTAFCLEEIAAFRRPGRSQSLLDAGCGSGILAIAAAKLGYQPVEGFDNDPDAVRISRINAAENGAAVLLRRADARRLPPKPAHAFDVVCANLTQDLLLALAPRLAVYLRPGGLLVLAGILDRDFQEVHDACVQLGLKPARSALVNEWRSGSFRK